MSDHAKRPASERWSRSASRREAFRPPTTTDVYYHRGPVAIVSHRDMGNVMKVNVSAPTEYHDNVVYRCNNQIKTAAQNAFEFEFASIIVVENEMRQCL